MIKIRLERVIDMLLKITTLLLSAALGLSVGSSFGHANSFGITREAKSAILRTVSELKGEKRHHNVLNWYVKRNPDHKQPALDPEQKIIEKYNAFYVDPNRGDNSEEKVIYLTFDAGYENGNIAKILDILAEEEVSAAFFILENLISSRPPLLKRMEDEGHFVCNHTTKHRDMSCVDSKEEFKKELESLESMYYNATGKSMKKFFRPPEGRFDEDNLKFADELGYTTVLWSLAYADWDNNKQPSTEYAKEKLLSNTHNGAIILLHPTSATNAEIMRDLIKTWKAEGYSFGTLDMLEK